MSKMQIGMIEAEEPDERSNFRRTADWLTACGKTPKLAGPLSTQIGCDLEEIVEYMENLRVDSDGWQRVLERAVIDLKDLAVEIKLGKRVAHIPEHLREATLDALCDREVTGNGVAFMAGFDKEEADRRVLQKNDDKLVDGKPVILPGGKIGKPKGWTPPDLSDLV